MAQDIADNKAEKTIVQEAESNVAANVADRFRDEIQQQTAVSSAVTDAANMVSKGAAALGEAELNGNSIEFKGRAAGGGRSEENHGLKIGDGGCIKFPPNELPHPPFERPFPFESVKKLPTGDILQRSADGTQKLFTPNGDSIVINPDGTHTIKGDLNKVTSNKDGSSTVEFADGSRVTFDEDGFRSVQRGNESVSFGRQIFKYPPLEGKPMPMPKFPGKFPGLPDDHGIKPNLKELETLGDGKRLKN